jgi:hypothetical protein
MFEGQRPHRCPTAFAEPELLGRPHLLGDFEELADVLLVYPD